MLEKSDKVKRRGKQIFHAEKNKSFREPSGRKAANARHEKKIAERGKIEAKRAKTAERLGRHDLIDVRLNGLDIA
jgi:hypothetical protein